MSVFEFVLAVTSIILSRSPGAAGAALGFAGMATHFLLIVSSLGTG